MHFIFLFFVLVKGLLRIATWCSIQPHRPASSLEYRDGRAENLQLTALVRSWTIVAGRGDGGHAPDSPPCPDQLVARPLPPGLEKLPSR